MSDFTQATRTLLEMSYWKGVGAAKLREVARVVAHNPGQELQSILALRFPKIEMPGRDERASSAGKAAKVLADCESQDIQLLSLADRDLYPTALTRIEDAPPLLYVRGKLSALHRPCVAVVGTREVSERGRRAAFVLSEYLAKRKVCVVSGLALGVDAAAHEGALAGNGLTIAVLAHGVEKMSPAANKGIGEQILATGGALVGEHPPGTIPRRAEFVRRNRIQSGLSLFSVIVETGEVGGAIHQANFTHQQGRQVYVVYPRDPAEGFKREGARLLMNTVGAKPLGGSNDLEAALWTANPFPPASEKDQMEFPL